MSEAERDAYKARLPELLRQAAREHDGATILAHPNVYGNFGIKYWGSTYVLGISMFKSEEIFYHPTSVACPPSQRDEGVISIESFAKQLTPKDTATVAKRLAELGYQ